MERFRFLPPILPLLAVLASAQETTSLPAEGVRFLDFVYIYYLPVLGILVLVFLVFLAANRFLPKRYSAVEFIATGSGILLALLLMVTGIVFLAATWVLAWGSATGDMSYGGAGEWAIPLSDEIQYYIQPALDTVSVDYAPYMESILLGLLFIGGVLLIAIGVLLIWKLPKTSFYEIMKPGGATTFKEVMTRGREPLTPTVTFKVIDRLTNQPSPDVKVILKHKEGAKVYNRYTDFNGEVVFQKIDGLYSQYYAFVEGDEERKRYWVIRTAIGAETVT